MQEKEYKHKEKTKTTIAENLQTIERTNGKMC